MRGHEHNLWNLMHMFLTNSEQGDVSWLIWIITSVRDSDVFVTSAQEDCVCSISLCPGNAVVQMTMGMIEVRKLSSAGSHASMRSNIVASKMQIHVEMVSLNLL